MREYVSRSQRLAAHTQPSAAVCGELGKRKSLRQTPLSNAHMCCGETAGGAGAKTGAAVLCVCLNIII